MPKPISPTVRDFYQQAKEQVKEAIRSTGYSYRSIANNHGVSLGFVNDCSKELREETGFARRPKVVK
jgi:transposase